MTPIPETWSELREAELAKLQEYQQELGFEADAAADVLGGPVPALARAFNGSPDYLARILVTSGAQTARQFCYLADDALPRLLAHGDEPAVVAPASAMSALSYVALMRCLSVPLPEAASGLEARWLTVVSAKPERLGDAGRRTAGLAAAAIGEVDVVPSFVGGGPLVPRKTPRDVVGVNIAGFTRHLAEVIKAGGGPGAVDGAWHSVLDAFPLTLASGGADWTDLVWAALALMVQIERKRPADVGTWLPELVASLD